MSATITAIDERLPLRDPLEVKLLPEPATIIILPMIRVERPKSSRASRNEPLPSDSEP